MQPLPRPVLVRHDVHVATDNPWQQRARLLQSLWRQERGLPIGEHRGTPLGSRLPMPFAKETLSNYLTETIRDVTRNEVLGASSKEQQKLFGQPRIWNDLLSSQPLCFNLFAELHADLALATRALALLGVPIRAATKIAFEHSPGRGDARYLSDRSAFDVFIEYVTPDAKRAFLGIEVKYHENLANEPGKHRSRYDEVADAMGCFSPSDRRRLLARPLQQIWRDHLLAGSMLVGETGYDQGAFVMLYPARNRWCADAVSAYQQCLVRDETFRTWTLEDVVDAIARAGAGKWIGDVEERYVKLEKIEGLT